MGAKGLQEVLAAIECRGGNGVPVHDVVGDAAVLLAVTPLRLDTVEDGVRRSGAIAEPLDVRVEGAGLLTPRLSGAGRNASRCLAGDFAEGAQVHG